MRSDTFQPTYGVRKGDPCGRRGLAFALILAHLGLSPLFFCTNTVEAFEENKVRLLTLTAILLTALAASVRLDYGGKRICDWLGDDLLTGGVILYTLSAIISTFASSNPRTSWRGAAESHSGLRTILGYVVLYFATRTLCRSVREGRRLLAVVVVASAIVTAYALVQFAQRDPLAWDGVSRFAAQPRPFSTLGHPNFLAAYLVMTTPLIAVFGVRAACGRQWLALGLLGLLGIAAGVVVVVALSRAAWLAGGCALVLLLAGWHRAGVFPIGWRAGGCVLVLGGMLLALLGSMASSHGEFAASLGERLRHVRDGEGRWEIWRASWEMFRTHPLTGCGLDAFRLGFGAHRPPAYSEVEWDATPTKAHNEVLHLLATQGTLGGLALVVLIVGLAQAAGRAWRRSTPTDRPFPIAVAACVVAFAVQNLFGFTVVGCGSLFVTCAALLSRWSQRDEAAKSVPGASMRAWPVCLAVTGVLAVFVFVLNAGVAGLLVCFLLAASGMLAALALSLVENSSPIEPRGAPRQPRHSSWLLHGILWTAVALVVWLHVVRPWRASVACHTGDALTQRDPCAAIAWHERAASLDPGSDHYPMRLSVSAHQAAQRAASEDERGAYLRQAAAALKQAIALVPTDAYHHANLGRLLGEQARLKLAAAEPALAEWDAALFLDPNNPVFLAEAARTALTVGDSTRARNYATHGLRLYPRYGPLHWQQAACALAEGCPTECVRQLDRLLRLDWHGDTEALASAFATLAAAHLSLRQFDAAELFARQAIRFQPTWPRAYLLRAHIFEVRKRYDAADH